MQNPQLIAFCGVMGSGKDTCCKALIDAYPNKNIVHVSFGQAVKDEVTKIHDRLILINSQKERQILCDEFNIDNLILTELEILINEAYKHYGEFNVLNKTPFVRKALQLWGQYRRSQDLYYWIDGVLRESLEFINQSKDNIVCISDARFVNEFERIKNLGGYLVYLNIDETLQKERLLKRDNYIPTEEVLNDSSELDCKEYRGYDVVIDDLSVPAEVLIKNTFKDLI